MRVVFLLLLGSITCAVVKTEIQICGTPQDDCSEFATCADTGPGTYTCTCNEGYTGDGKTCDDFEVPCRINGGRCVDNPGECQHYEFLCSLPCADSHFCCCRQE